MGMGMRRRWNCKWVKISAPLLFESHQHLLNTFTKNRKLTEARRKSENTGLLLSLLCLVTLTSHLGLKLATRLTGSSLLLNWLERKTDIRLISCFALIEKVKQVFLKFETKLCIASRLAPFWYAYSKRKCWLKINTVCISILPAAWIQN